MCEVCSNAQTMLCLQNACINVQACNVELERLLLRRLHGLLSLSLMKPGSLIWQPQTSCLVSTSCLLMSPWGWLSADVSMFAGVPLRMVVPLGLVVFSWLSADVPLRLVASICWCPPEASCLLMPEAGCLADVPLGLVFCWCSPEASCPAICLLSVVGLAPC